MEKTFVDLFAPLAKNLGLTDEQASELFSGQTIENEFFDSFASKINSLTSIEAAKSSPDLEAYFGEKAIKKAESEVFGRFKEAGIDVPDLRSIEGGIQDKMLAMAQHFKTSTEKEKAELKAKLSQNTDGTVQTLTQQLSEFQETLAAEKAAREQAENGLTEYKQNQAILKHLAGKNWAQTNDPNYATWRQQEIISRAKKIAELKEVDGEYKPFVPGTDAQWFGQDKSSAGSIKDLVDSIAFEFEAKNASGNPPPTTTTTKNGNGSNKLEAWKNANIRNPNKQLPQV